MPKNWRVTSQKTIFHMNFYGLIYPTGLPHHQTGRNHLWRAGMQLPSSFFLLHFQSSVLLLSGQCCSSIYCCVLFTFSFILINCFGETERSSHLIFWTRLIAVLLSFLSSIILTCRRSLHQNWSVLLKLTFFSLSYLLFCSLNVCFKSTGAPFYYFSSPQVSNMLHIKQTW